MSAVITNHWRVRRTGPGGFGRGGAMAVAPGCPDTPHPTRDCGCRSFPNASAAQDYIDAQLADGSRP